MKEPYLESSDPKKWRKTVPLLPTKTALCRVKVFQHIRMPPSKVKMKTKMRMRRLRALASAGVVPTTGQ